MVRMSLWNQQQMTATVKNCCQHLTLLLTFPRTEKSLFCLVVAILALRIQQFFTSYFNTFQEFSVSWACNGYNHSIKCHTFKSCRFLFPFSVFLRLDTSWFLFFCLLLIAFWRVSITIHRCKLLYPAHNLVIILK